MNKVLRWTTPQELLVAYHVTRSMRSELGTLLPYHKHVVLMFDNRGFGKAAQTLWNKLCQHQEMQNTRCLQEECEDKCFSASFT